MHFNVHGPGHIVTAAADLRGSDQFGTAVILMQSVILGRSFRTPQPEIAFRTRDIRIQRTRPNLNGLRGSRIRSAAKIIIVVAPVHQISQRQLFQIGSTCGAPRPHPRFVQCRQKHCCHDCNNCDYDQKLYKSHN